MRSKALPYIIAATLAVPAVSLAAPDDTQTRRDQSTRDQSTMERATDRATKDHSMHSGDRAMMTKNVDASEFAQKAAVISKAEIELGEMALEKSSNDDVKKFAKRMVTDHTASSAKLKTVAGKENISLPQSLDTEHKATKQKLSALRGEEFDREYMKAMSNGHDKAVALFESASQSTEVSPDLKQFASSTLPTLRDHQKMAHTLHGKTDVGMKRTAND